MQKKLMWTNTWTTSSGLIWIVLVQGYWVCFSSLTDSAVSLFIKWIFFLTNEPNVQDIIASLAVSSRSQKAGINGILARHLEGCILQSVGRSVTCRTNTARATSNDILSSEYRGHSAREMTGRWLNGVEEQGVRYYGWIRDRRRTVLLLRISAVITCDCRAVSQTYGRSVRPTV